MKSRKNLEANHPELVSPNFPTQRVSERSINAFDQQIAKMAELYQVAVPAVNEPIKGIDADKELSPKATIRKYRIVQTEGVNEPRSRWKRQAHPPPTVRKAVTVHEH